MNCGEESLSANGTVQKEGYWHYGYDFGRQSAGVCYPVTHGSQTCQPHDLTVDPICLSNDPPSYCTESWCYVDVEKCKDSSELLFQSDLFTESLGQKLFYSYSTCNASDSWHSCRSTEVLDGRSISVTIPEVWAPAHYKLAADGNIALSTGSEYFDDSIPWQGWVVDYLDAILEISNIKSFNYTHRSGGSEVAVTSSIYTGAVHDVQTGVSCLAASLFWITSQRLAMTAFTTTISTDKIFLWIENPSSGTGLSKVLRPFDPTLWIALFLAVCGVSILSVWFASENGERRKWWQKLRGEAWANGTLLERARIFGMVLLDSFLANTTYFFGHTVEFDVASSLPMKILNFGFGFVILISVAAYTANLAAFLTISAVADYVGSMDEAIQTKTRVCGHPALKDDLQIVWPGAEWVFNTDNPNSYDGMLENFDAGLCKAIVAGIFDVQNDEIIMGNFCKRGIVSSGSLVLEKPLGLPACSGFAAGLSYWMAEAEKQRITFDSFEATSRPALLCSLVLEKEAAVDELLALSLLDFALPFLVLIICAVFAVVLHLSTARRRKNQFSNDSENTGGIDVDDLRLLESMNGSVVSKGEDEFEKPYRIEAAEKDSLEEPKFCVEPSSLKLPGPPSSDLGLPLMEESMNSKMLVLLPVREITNSQTMFDTMRDLQRYQNNLIDKIMAEEKIE
jgi:hypothetical protein